MKKKLLSLLLALAMVFTLAACGEKKPDPGKDATATEPVVILHTNDVHGAVSNYAKVAALASQYESEGAYVLILDAGDFSQGDTAVSVSEGATAVELMNMVGYDAVALGNHEFDYGFEALKKNMENAQFPVLAANVKYNGELAFDDAAVFTTPGGTKIGVFGLDTPETATKAHPGKIQGVTFAGGEELYQIAQDMANMLREDEGCNYVICLGHLGIDDETAATGNRSIDLLNKVTGIDVFIDGHSHSTEEEIVEKTNTDRKVGDTILTSTGTKLENIGVVAIKDSTITTTCVPTEGIEVAADDAIAARAAAIIAEIEADYGTVFAKTEVTLNGEKDPGNRTQETNLGDLITDALVWGAEQQGETVDAAITNGGGIRATIEAGDITKKDVNTVLPFGNTLSIIKITGTELLEVLEASTFCTPEAIGGFPQVSGIEFTVDTTKGYDQGDEYPGTTYFAPKTINRVTIQTVGGKDFDPAATYTIATNDFMASGGDTYYRFVNATANYDLGIPMDEVVMDYITDELDGVVTAEDYGAPNGRITIEKGLPFTDVAADAAYYDEVKYCYDNNIFKGVTATTFAPLSTLTRGQMVTVLWRMNGSPAPAGTCPFTDVAADSPFRQAITWAAEKGLTNGTTATTFAPGQAISRQQFLTILYRYAQFMKYDVSKTATIIGVYADWGAVSEYAQEAMEWAAGSGVLIADKALRPTDAALRYEVAEFLANFCQKVAAETTLQQAA